MSEGSTFGVNTSLFLSLKCSDEEILDFPNTFSHVLERIELTLRFWIGLELIPVEQITFYLSLLNRFIIICFKK